jgi:hypothetical protein
MLLSWLPERVSDESKNHLEHMKFEGGINKCKILERFINNVGAHAFYIDVVNGKCSGDNVNMSATKVIKTRFPHIGEERDGFKNL